MKLFDSELKVMSVLWREGDVPARRVAEVLEAEVGWNINTTYTLIKRCIGKDAIERRDPGFVCHALVPRAAVLRQEAEALLDKLFEGSTEKLVASLVGGDRLTPDEVTKLRRLIDEMK